jgi:hypothetical protein
MRRPTHPSDASRAARYDDRLHHYDHHRRHAGLEGSTPAERVGATTPEDVTDGGARVVLEPEGGVALLFSRVAMAFSTESGMRRACWRGSRTLQRTAGRGGSILPGG